MQSSSGWHVSSYIANEGRGSRWEVGTEGTEVKVKVETP